MDVQAVLKQLQQQLEQLVAQAQAQPIAVPAAAALAGLLVAIFLFYNVARAAPRTGSVYQGGVRRSTRQHKAPQQYHPESPAPAKTPRAALVQKTPKTAKKAAEEKEATTVTPKAATRPRRAAAKTPAKTPATAEPATVTRRSTRASAKTPAK